MTTANVMVTRSVNVGGTIDCAYCVDLLITSFVRAPELGQNCMTLSHIKKNVLAVTLKLTSCDGNMKLLVPA